MISTIIVDDEPLARERLRTLVGAAGGLEVVAECGDGLAAVRAIEHHRPGLIFLDIQMPEMDGFEVLQALDSPPPATIFVTAYDRYAVRAYDADNRAAIDRLTWSVSEVMFGPNLISDGSAAARRSRSSSGGSSRCPRASSARSSRRASASTIR